MWQWCFQSHTRLGPTAPWESTSSLGQGRLMGKSHTRMRRGTGTRKRTYITHIHDSLLILKSDPTCLCLSSRNCKLNLKSECVLNTAGPEGLYHCFSWNWWLRHFAAAPLRSSDQLDRKQLPNTLLSLMLNTTRRCYPSRAVCGVTASHPGRNRICRRVTELSDPL